MAGDGTLARSPVATVPLSGRRPARIAAVGVPRARLPAAVRDAGLPRPQWRLRLAGSVQGGIAAAGRVLVAGSTGGDVAAVRVAADPEDRRVSWLWRVRIGPVYRRPDVSGRIGRAARTVFVPSADEHLYALDADTGRIRWRFAAGAPVLSEPLIAPGHVVFTAGERLLAVDAAYRAAGLGRAQ